MTWLFEIGMSRRTATPSSGPVASTVGERSRAERAPVRSDVPLTHPSLATFILRDFIFAQVIHRKFLVQRAFLGAFMEVNGSLQEG